MHDLLIGKMTSQSSHGWEKCLSKLKDSRDNSPYSVVDSNSNTDSHSGSPTKTSKEENSSSHFDFFTSSFLVTMLVMTTDTTFIEEQLAKMAYAIAKLTNTIKEKYIQIAFLIKKVEAQAQHTIESSQ